METKRYCTLCKKYTQPERDLNLAVLIILAVLFWPAAIVYYFYVVRMKNLVCTDCKQKTYGIEPMGQ